MCDDHTPRALSLAAFCHNLANFFQNSNFDIAGAEDPSAQALAMSKFDSFLKIGQDMAKCVFLKIKLQNPH